MRFTKYHKYGGYHWKWYLNKPKYINHVNFLKEWVKEKNALDIGAGDGLIANQLGIIGIDNEPEAIRVAKERGQEIILGDAYKLPFENEKFDVALMADILEHLEFPEKALQEAKRILKNYLYVASPVVNFATRSEVFHYKNYEPDDIKTLVEAQGFTEIERITRGTKFYIKFKK